MSEPNAELIDHLVAAWNRRDVETILELTGADVEYVNAPAALEPGTRRGHDAIVDVFRKQWEGLGDADMVVVRADVRGGEVLTDIRIGRSMPGSDSRVDNRILLAWTVDAGLVTRLRVLGSEVSFDDLTQSDPRR